MSKNHNPKIALNLSRTTRLFGPCLLAILLTFNAVSFTPVALASSSTIPFGILTRLDDSPSPTPTPAATPDEVLEQAKREALIADELKKKAVSEQQRQEAENAKLKAEVQPLGAANVTVPTGSVQTDASGWVESQMLAQEAARQITTKLTNQLCTGNVLPGGITEQRLGEAAPTQNIDMLVIYNNSDLGGVELYVTVLGQLTELKTEYGIENPKAVTLLSNTDPRSTPALALAGFPILAAPAVASATIKSVAELVNLFRTDTSFQNRSVQISEDMIVSHVVSSFGAGMPAGSHCNGSIRVYYPALYPVNLTKSTQTSAILILLNQVEGLKNASAILLEQTDARIRDINNLRTLQAEKLKKNTRLGAIPAAIAAKTKELNTCPTSAICGRIREEIRDLHKESADLTTRIVEIDLELLPTPPVGAVIAANTPSFKTWLLKLNEQKLNLQARITATDVLSAKLNTPDPTTKFTALAQLLRAEKLNTILEKPQTFTLRVAANANGTTKVKKNLFVDAKVRHSAGANIVYQLFNRDGALAQGDVMQCYISYKSSQEVEGVMSGSRTVECKSR